MIEVMSKETKKRIIGMMKRIKHNNEINIKSVR